MLARLQDAGDLLQPFDAMQTGLHEVKPSYSVDFVFKIEAGYFQLSKSWDRIENAKGSGFKLFLKEEKWLRLDRDTGKAADLFDLVNTDLWTGSAWQFDIKTSGALENLRIPAELRKFSQKVRISIRPELDEPSVTWSHSFCPGFVRQSTVYRYIVSETDYTLELSHFQIQEVVPRDSPTAASETKINVYEKRWGLNVYRKDWDTSFARNERLQIAEEAKWNDDFNEWFPSRLSDQGANGEDGFEVLLEKLSSIEKVVRTSASGPDMQRSSLSEV